MQIFSNVLTNSVLVLQTLGKLAIYLQALCSEMLCCNVKFIFLKNLIIRSKFCSDVLKENSCLIKVYFVPDQVSVNGFFLFYFVCLFLVVFLIPCQFVPWGRGI